MNLHIYVVAVVVAGYIISLIFDIIVVTFTISFVMLNGSLLSIIIIVVTDVFVVVLVVVVVVMNYTIYAIIITSDIVFKNSVCYVFYIYISFITYL